MSYQAKESGMGTRLDNTRKIFTPTETQRSQGKIAHISMY
jgi:hypothetical protein